MHSTVDAPTAGRAGPSTAATDPSTVASVPSTDWGREWRPLAWIVAVFAAAYFLPADAVRFQGGVTEALALTRDYARLHVLLCLVPAFYIAGAISVFLNQQTVLRYLGPSAPKPVAYGVASVAGTVLAVCSCTVLPLFAGIYTTGAGLGPATAFLYSGPAINVLAMVLTARVLGLKIGVARAVGAVVFALVIGLAMHALFRREERARADAVSASAGAGAGAGRPLWQTVAYFALMIGVLVFANWGRPDTATGLWHAIYAAKWVVTALLGGALGVVLTAWFGLRRLHLAWIAGVTLVLALAFPGRPVLAFAAATVGLSIVASRSAGELGDWFAASWGFAKQILPLLLIGILVAGFLLGRPGHEGILPSAWVAQAVGGNSVVANLFASVAGAFMYFATLTEVPILQGLIGNGMGDGPALALLLAGPALSLPSILVIRSVLGVRKTLAFVMLVVVMATLTGVLYGAL
ncbi:MAG TPA: permease [Longimicrobiales bacterium]|nr:permease [Longimicrobiales bacterium]